MTKVKVKVNKKVFEMLENSKFWYGLYNYKYNLYRMKFDGEFHDENFSLEELRHLSVDRLIEILNNDYELETSKEERIASVCDVYRENPDDFDKGFNAGVTYIANEYGIKIPRINC